MPRAATVTVVGVGLMGGSLGMALRRRGGWRVRGLARRRRTLWEARRRGALDEGFLSPAPALRGADVVVLCVPVDRIVSQARALKPFIDPGALVMDVGSVKGVVVAGADTIFASPAGPVFVGAHPMAGSEKAGVACARADLYRGAVCAVTPSARTSEGAVRRAERFWRAVGANPLRIDPHTHDRCVAFVSHLPHLLADALVLAAERIAPHGEGRDLLRRLAAGSFRSATRVAGADPALWRAIFSMNDPSLRQALAAFQSELNGLSRARWPLKRLARARVMRDWFEGPETP